MSKKQGGQITVYVSPEDLPVLEQLERVKMSQGISISKIVIMSLRSYLPILNNINKKATITKK
jgi:hypothetical protein